MTGNKNIAFFGSGGIPLLNRLLSDDDQVPVWTVRGTWAMVPSRSFGGGSIPNTFVVAGASPNTDSAALIRAAIARCKVAGGGTVILPYIGGYKISGQILVDFSNCTIELHDNVTLTKTTADRAFYFLGQLTVPIVNSGLVGVDARWKIDGNGRNMTGYVYNPSATLYPVAHFRYTENCFAKNVWFYNGLVNSLLFEFTKGSLAQDVDGTDAVYDNGISVNFGPTWSSANPFSPADPKTWTNAVFENCRAWNNKGIGITNYAAVGVVMISPQAWNNGNDVAGFPTNGGGISVEANAFGNVALAQRDSQTVIVSPQVTNNYNIGLYSSAVGVLVVGGHIQGTIAPVNRPNPLSLYGSNVILLNAATMKISGAVVEGAGAHGIRLLAGAVDGTNLYPSIDFDGTVKTSYRHNIYAQGFNRVATGAATQVLESGYGQPVSPASNFNGIRLENGGAAFNVGRGVAVINGRLQDNAGLALEAIGVGEVHIPSLSGRFNRKLLGTSGSQYRFDLCTYVMIGYIQNRDETGYNSTVNIVEIKNNCSNGFVGIAVGSALGDPVSNLAAATPPHFVAVTG